MPQDKLSRINDQLLITGENPVPVEDDGSNEWNVCSAAFNIFAAQLERHGWNFATGIEALNRVGDSPDNQFDDAFAKPDGCLHIVWVRLDDRAPFAWRIIDNKVCLTRGSPAAVVTAKFVRDVDESEWSNVFGEALNLYIRAGIYEGIKKDFGAARTLRAEGEVWLAEARTRTDQQQPKRALFRSRLKQSRLTRRPVWPRNMPDNVE